MNPKISIIIPVYNVEDYLEQCLDSILNETYSNYEIILVDDGSSDSSPAICDRYSKNYSNVDVIHKRNEGVSVARNVGIEKSKGEYIVFIDSDDWVREDFLKVLDANAGNADLLFFSNVNVCDKELLVTYEIGNFYSDDRKQIEDEILHLFNNLAHHDFYGFTWNKLFRADIIKEHNIRFVPGLSVFEDEIFTNDYVKYIHSMQVLNTPIYYYRKRLDGLTCQRKTTEHFKVLAEKTIEFIAYIHTPEAKIFYLRRAEDFVFSAYLQKDGAGFSFVRKNLLELKQMGHPFPSSRLFKSIVRRLLGRY